MGVPNMPIPSPPLRVMQFATSLMYNPKVGESGHPCFTPMVMVITYERPLGHPTCLNICLYNAHIAYIMSEGILNAESLCRRYSLCILLKVWWKSVKHPYNHNFCIHAWFTKQCDFKDVLSGKVLHGDENVMRLAHTFCSSIFSSIVNNELFQT